MVMLEHLETGATLSDKAWKAAGPVALVSRRSASKTLDDILASPAAFLLPGGTLRRSL